MQQNEEQSSPYILFADDNPDILQMLATYARLHGYRVETAESAEEMLEQITKHCIETGTCFDLVVGDLSYKSTTGELRLDGLSALRRIRKLFPNLPFLFLSGFGEPLTIIEAKNLGAEFVQKPADLHTFFARIESTLSITKKNYDGPDRRLRSMNQTENFRRADDPKSLENIKLEVPPELAEIHQKIASAKKG